MAKKTTPARALPEFDSEAQDELATKQAQIKGLAACLVVLGDHESPYLLADDAISSLGLVMRQLTEDAEQLRHKMWAQYLAMRAVAEVSHD